MYGNNVYFCSVFNIFGGFKRFWIIIGWICGRYKEVKWLVDNIDRDVRCGFVFYCKYSCFWGLVFGFYLVGDW